MKKSLSLVLVFVMCLSLCACGGRQKLSAKTNGKYTIDDLVGVWHSEDSQQILLVSPDNTSRYHYAPKSFMPDVDYHLEIDKDIVSYSRLGKFQLKREDDGLKIVCIETGKVGKGTEFLKVENIITEEDLNGDWYSSATGNSMKIIEGEIHPNHKEGTIYRQWCIAGDTLYIFDFGVFKIEVDGSTVKLVDGNEELVRLSSDDLLRAELPTDKRIDFSEPIFLFEDNNVRLEASAFYQETRKDWNSPAEYKEYITLRFRNKADYEIILTPDQFYIGDEKVKWGYVEGTPQILPGKVANYSFRIQKDTDKPLDSMEDLYRLDGRFEVFRYENNRLYDRYYLPFSIEEAYSSGK